MNINKISITRNRSNNYNQINQTDEELTRDEILDEPEINQNTDQINNTNLYKFRMIGKFL